MVKKYAERLKIKQLFFYDKNGAEVKLTCWVQDAEKEVWMQGHALHVINGEPGLSFACALAKCSKDKENREKFPDGCRLASFLKSTAFIVTHKKIQGLPVAIRYHHSYGALVDLNDERVAQEKARKDPEFFERSYRLRVPLKAVHKPGRHITKNHNGPSHRAVLPRGALARAMRAGLIDPRIAESVLHGEPPDSYERRRAEFLMNEGKTKTE
jgi:hypothetical protein